MTKIINNTLDRKKTGINKIINEIISDKRFTINILNNRMPFIIKIINRTPDLKKLNLI